MTSRKRNEFLDLPSDEDNDNDHKDHNNRDGRSESEDRGYDSEAVEESRIRGRGSGRGRRLQAQPPAKRRRIAEGYLGDEGSESESGDEEDSKDDETKEGTKLMKGKSTGSALQDPRFAAIFSENEDDEENDGASKTQELHDRNDEDDSTHSPHNVRRKPIKASKKKNKTGVIYLSSLPPYLKPFALKNMLETRGFGPINRIFLTPFLPSSSSSSSMSRRSANKRKTYTDGWVEFESKKTAKICAETLNASIVGGRKGGWYHDDVWNMKYLRGFKWADLMEQVQRERSEREAKRRIEDARARKEEKVFLAGVEKGRVLDGMKRKKEEKIKRLANAERNDDQLHRGDGGQILTKSQAPVRRVFKQNEVKIRRDTDRNEAVLAEDAKRVLGKIF